MYDNNNASKANDFSLSENVRLLGILCIAREDNAIVVEIKIGENGANDPLSYVWPLTSRIGIVSSRSQK